jgi:hypothetical protein
MEELRIRRVYLGRICDTVFETGHRRAPMAVTELQWTRFLENTGHKW